MIFSRMYGACPNRRPWPIDRKHRRTSI